MGREVDGMWEEGKRGIWELRFFSGEGGTWGVLDDLEGLMVGGGKGGIWQRGR